MQADVKIEAVIFDMDGLMIDSERIVQRSWNIVGKRMGYENLGEDIYHTMGLSVIGREQYFKGKYGEEFPFQKFLTDYRKEYYNYVNVHGIDAKPGLYQLLETVKQLGIPMVVATSTGRESAMKNLEMKNVVPYFKGFVCGDMVTESKPSPEIYLKACQLADVNPKHAIALEDSFNGIKAAYAAGMMPVMVPDLIKDTSEVDHLLFAKKSDLKEVAKMFENLVSQSVH